ncbi:hypothetical protein [Pseudomonas phage PA1C]|uniref:Uncharacterized protein n=1 Tax=Pseudomonas phage vB_PaeM_PS119XW TaxID=2601632 RepID=A0A5C1K7C7_9CAUD|nr:hypothetical protein PP933_gp288 [Pseudomonas phage vB_PaeM_PS119XW]QBX32446.1 hypothetical protein [Pseudomonas phage PA1C]QEM42017.1 hypothetical protein [Pseudomonas phage vB_PaeM_PS119XW]BEG72533.1 hypothetical protein RVBP21_1610 [Pseudomonas phage BRkr]
MSQEIDLTVSPLEPRKETPLQPTDVFDIVRKCGLTEDFKRLCYEDATPEELDFNPDVVTVYRHDLGLKFLRGKNLPTTLEDLKDRTEVLFETMTAGKIDYKAGEMIVLFPRPVYSGSDLKNNMVIAIVKEDFKFESDVDLNCGGEENFEIAMRPYVEGGQLELVTNPGLRVYSAYERWTFLERFK